MTRSVVQSVGYVVRHEEELRRFPRLGLLMADAVILTGVGGELEVVFVPEEFRPDVRIETVSSVEAPVTVAGFSSFTSDVLVPWYREAQPLIEAGRLLYLPRRVLIHRPGPFEVGQVNWIENAEQMTAWGLWQAINRRDADNVLSDENELTRWVREELLTLVLPFIDGISLDRLAKVLSDEEHTLASFRKEIATVLPTFLQVAEKCEDMNDLRRLAAEIRRDVAAPAIAKLSRTLERIVAVRSIRTAGAVVSTVTLSVAVLSSGDINPLLTSLTAGSMGALALEYAGYQGERLALKEDPWYFAWALSRAAR